MTDRTFPEMADALRLTRAGKLMEATALIQRVLRGGEPASAGAGPVIIDAATFETGEAPDLGAKGPHMERPHASLRETVTRVVAMAREFAADTRGRPEPVPEGAAFTTASYANAAGSRQYKLYVPANRAAEPALIVMLHGCTQNPDDFAAGTRMNVFAEEHGFLVAYPQQTMRANMRQCWNWFRPEDQRRGEGEPSLIAGLTGAVIREYGVDPKRVYIAGLSAGGAAAAIMGDVYPDLYAGVGVHSGLPSASARDLSSAFDAMRLGAKVGAPSARFIPTIVFHGGRDSIVNPVNADAVAAKAVGAMPGLRQETEHGEAAGGHAYVRTLYADETGRTLCELWRIPECGHAWSGGSRAGSHTDPLGPDASQEMVRFFFQHAN